ncbi:MAG: DNA-binding protein [Oscillospiraceae bacterium]|nr:DNA-binding protein [Oscillospiraceae bacterium]
MEPEYNYQKILSDYPATITKDQLYRICHISKRTASYLLESGLIPNVNSGKKTRKYTIATVNVIAYLKQRRLFPELYAAPAGLYAGNGGARHSLLQKDPYLYLSQEGKDQQRTFFYKKANDWPDVMNIQEVCDFTGYTSTSIIRWCEKQFVKSFHISGRFMIPKISLIEFMVGLHFLGIQRKSENHTALLREFEKAELEAL